ncbi:hypothetical protein M472_21645 [Sphingobacterium paucimobilis HER1398]|uniref:Thioredoxin domain-containing protein n=2 Tax=Sphingobacterium TaxID=28453 RepID=U2JFA7_9SPHI|nr:hypothetical protein M472_21645 [Sphingobacterium paucimobilis HER1398]
MGHSGWSQGIVFHTNLEESLKEAKQQKKLVFVDFYTSWCGPCKALSANVFPQQIVGDFYNEKFISVKIQCDDSGYGVALGKQYKVAAYPTLMFLDGNGDIVHSTAGAPDAQGLIELGKTALDPQKNQLSLLKEWDSGNREEAFMRKYFSSLMRAYQNAKAHDDFEQYFATLSKAEKASSFTFELMQTVKELPFSPAFDYLEQNKADYYQTVGKGKVDSTIAKSYLWYLKNLQYGGMMNKDLTEFNTKLAQFKAKNYPYYDEYVAFYDVFDFKNSDNKSDAEIFMTKGTAFLAKYGLNNDDYTISLTMMLANLIWGKDKGVAGIEWMERLVDRNPDVRYLDSYFHILFRNLRWDQALEVAQRIKEEQIKQNRSTKDIDQKIQSIADARLKYGG